MISWIDLRDADGVFLGMCDIPESAGRQYPTVRVPVPAQEVVNVHAPTLTPLLCPMIEIALAQWQEVDGTRRWVWRLEHGAQEQLARVRRVILSGATCETAYGRAVRQFEALVRLVGMLRLLRLDPSTATVQ